MAKSEDKQDFAMVFDDPENYMALALISNISDSDIDKIIDAQNNEDSEEEKIEQITEDVPDNANGPRTTWRYDPNVERVHAELSHLPIEMARRLVLRGAYDREDDYPESQGLSYGPY
jgi:hypothetical protein